MGQLHAGVGPVDLELPGVGAAKALATALALEAGKAGLASGLEVGEEVPAGHLECLERLVQWMHGRILEPKGLDVASPPGQAFAEIDVADELAAGLVAGLLQSRGLVEDEPTGTSKTTHGRRLRSVGHRFERVGLEPPHGSMTFGLMDNDNDNDNDIRKGRHCAFLMHAHLVFVTRCRRGVFTKEVLGDLRSILAGVCADFEAQWVEFDGQDDHVHLLVNYPPEVAVPDLVNSLEGVSSRMMRHKDHPSIRNKLWGRALWSPSHVAASWGGAPIAVIRLYIEQQRTPDSPPPGTGPAWLTALAFPALKDGA